uniref:Uncharacterized protein n=1 Tax=Acanthochromis polyacanthus TaxID=80966 RepID=A0A3Q1F621_9TELE
MARTGAGTLLCRRNVRLDSFLKRNTERAVYERIRAYEPCVVRSDTVNKVYMHVVLSDERVYLTEYPPRALTAAVSFGRVRDIDLVSLVMTFAASNLLSLSLFLVSIRTNSQWREDLFPLIKPTRSASCPDPETLGLVRLPHPPSLPPPGSSTSSLSPSEQNLKTPVQRMLTHPVLLQVSRRFGSVLSRLLRRDCASSDEEKEAELHLYAVSQTSRLYLHLQSAWNSFLIRSTLLLDPLYRRRCSASSDSAAPAISWELTAHLFGQLSSELLQDGISVESLYLLLQELRTAGHRNITLRRLFWKSGEVCVFLVQTLEDCLHSCQSLSGSYTADQLLLSTVIVQTLAVMFRETEVEAARINLLSAKKGALASQMLLALICDPELQTQSRGSPTDSELQTLLAEYLDASCSLLFELLCSPVDNHLSVGWMLRVLQPHPHLVSFIGYQAQQVLLVLSNLQKSVLSPVQSVLLFQRCRLLLACLQYNNQLAQHLRSNFGEEFRYSVKPSCVEEKLPPQYPISRPTLRLVESILNRMLLR